MRVYGSAYRDTMNLPMKVFWHISGTVPRLLAGERKDTLELMVSSSHSSSGAVELFRQLDEVAKDPVVMSGKGRMEMTAERDEGGISILRSLM